MSCGSTWRTGTEERAQLSTPLSPLTQRTLGISFTWAASPVAQQVRVVSDKETANLNEDYLGSSRGFGMKTGNITKW